MDKGYFSSFIAHDRGVLKSTEKFHKLVRSGGILLANHFLIKTSIKCSSPASQFKTGPNSVAEIFQQNYVDSAEKGMSAVCAKIIDSTSNVRKVKIKILEYTPHEILLHRIDELSNDTPIWHPMTVYRSCILHYDGVGAYQFQSSFDCYLHKTSQFTILSAESERLTSDRLYFTSPLIVSWLYTINAEVDHSDCWCKIRDIFKESFQAFELRSSSQLVTRCGLQQGVDKSIEKMIATFPLEMVEVNLSGYIYKRWPR